MEDLPVKKGRLILATGLGLFVLACTPATDPLTFEPPYPPAERLAGTWHWVQSLDVKTTQVHTPLSEGFIADLTFAADGPRSGSFTYQRAGAEVTTGRFTIDSEDGPGNDFITVDTSIDFLTRNAWVTVGQDSLRLGGVFETGYNSVYARVSQ